MGCSSSTLAYDDDDGITLKLLESFFDTFRISLSDIDLFKKAFSKIDVTHDGSIEIAEIEIYLKHEKALFNTRILTMYDADKSGELELFEFMIMCHTYCTIGISDLEEFLFNMYDSDKSGCITRVEIEQLITDLFGKHNNTMGKEFVKNIPNGEVYFSEFHHFISNHRGLLKPVIELQNILRQKIVNESYWREKTSIRSTIDKSIVNAEIKKARQILIENSHKKRPKNVKSTKPSKKKVLPMEDMKAKNNDSSKGVSTRIPQSRRGSNTSDNGRDINKSNSQDHSGHGHHEKDKNKNHDNNGRRSSGSTAHDPDTRRPSGGGSRNHSNAHNPVLISPNILKRNSISQESAIIPESIPQRRNSTAHKTMGETHTIATQKNIITAFEDSDTAYHRRKNVELKHDDNDIAGAHHRRKSVELKHK